jgi:thiosulfate dehydrogenase [quinone] large subunit
MTSNTARRIKARANGTAASAADSAAVGADTVWHVHRPDGSIPPGWYLLPLRLFLGVTFLFAGLQKLANPNFFRVSSPGSIHAQMVGATHTSPIGSLLGHLVGISPLIGLLIAVAEVAIGVGTLLGLLTRVAAVGGMIVSLSLFLAVSFHTAPYYTGADIVFLFAWMPFVLAGAGDAPALDTWMKLRGAGVPDGSGRADGSGPVMSRGAVIGLVAGGTALFAGAVAGIGQVLNTSAPAATTDTLPGPGATTTTAAGGATTTTTAGGVPKGTKIGPASSVPVGGSAAFTNPSTGDPSLVIQHTTDQFVAFDAICPHAGCTVAYQAAANIIACPCHGSEFNPQNGDVVLGPATFGLTPIKIIKGANGNLYVV